MDEVAVLAVVAVLIIVAVSHFAPRIGVAAPIGLVLVGIACSFVPGAPEFVVPPELILAVVLPPLLYAAAVNMPATDFRRDIGSIGALSVLLVVASAFASGTVIWLLLPDLSFAGAVAVGAVISPPDAVAATSIGKKLGLPSRLVTILEGEGLVNDATALVMLRSAVAAVAGGVTFVGAVGDFAYAVVVAVIVGALVGVVTVAVRSRIDQPVLTTLISFVVPFIAFIPAEAFHASGVLAVVVAGLITGARSARHFTPSDRITERTNWRTVQLLLEGAVFLLMGYQVRTLVDDVLRAGLPVWNAVGIGLLATLVLVVVRTLFVVPLIAWLRRSQRRGKERVRVIEDALERIEAHPDHDNPRVDRAQRFLRRRHADASFLVKQGLGWRGGAVLAWSGMRGVVTLAAAQSLPADMPYRSELILIAFTVAIVTLVGHGATLPWVIRTLGVRGESTDEKRREFGMLMGELQTSVADLFDGDALRRPDGTPFDGHVVEEVRRRLIRTQDDRDTMEEWRAQPAAVQQRLELQRLVIDAQQAALQDARGSGQYRSATIELAQHALDISAARFDEPPLG